MRRSILYVVASCSVLLSLFTSCAQHSTEQQSQIVSKKLAFSLPSQVNWQKNNDVQLEASNVFEWFVEGTSSRTSPARILYQTLDQHSDVDALFTKMLKPLENCFDSKITQVSSSNELFFLKKAECSSFANASYGLIDYILVYPTQTSTQLILAEIRTPATKKLNITKFKTSQDQQWYDISQQFSMIFDQFIHSVSICESTSEPCVD